MYGGWGGWGWLMMLMPLVWVVLIGVSVWAAVRVAQRPAEREAPRRETPLEILDWRLASGEVDIDAYSRMREQLVRRPDKP